MRTEVPGQRRRKQEIRQIINGLRAIMSAERKLSQQLSKQYRITARQLGTLRIVSQSPGISLGELADRMYLHISTASGIIDRLEEKELLIRERSSSDLRIVHLRITPRGSRITRAVPITGFGFLMKDINALRSSDVHAIWAGMKGLLELMRMVPDALKPETTDD